MKTATPSIAAFQALMDEMLSSDLAIDRYTIYIATRQVKTSQPNLTKLITKSEK
jgi:Lrp/AsnC family transcriptional regulator of ectoine degradation